MHETFLLLHDYTTIISRNPWRKNISWRKNLCFERNLINIIPLHARWLKNQWKVLCSIKILRSLRSLLLVTKKRKFLSTDRQCPEFPQFGWSHRDPITNISFTLLINLAMQFLQSFRVGVLHCFFTWHDLFIENFLLGFGGVVVTLTFMLHCLLQ